MSKDRVEFKMFGRRFVVIWQPVRQVWDVYRAPDGYVTRVYLTNQPSVDAAKKAVRDRHRPGH